MSPVYEYLCPKCGEALEMIQKHADPAPICVNLECQEGDPTVMIKQLSQGSFILKGKGWYKTDYPCKK